MESTPRQNCGGDRANMRQVKNGKGCEEKKGNKMLDEELRRIFEENERKIRVLEKLERKLSSELKNHRR